MMGQAHRCAARRCAGLATAALVVWLAAVLGVFPGASAFALSDNQDSQAIVSTVSEDADSVGAVVLEGTGNAHASEAEFAETLSVLPDIAAAAKEATVQAAASSIGWAPGGGMSAQMLADPEASVHSYAGATMYETAIAEAKAAYPKGTKTAIIAGPGGAWVDALSAAGLAASCGPILFSEQDSMNEATLKALSELGVKSVIIVGGTAAVGEGVEEDLGKAGIKVAKRLWGEDCLGTQMSIYRYGLNRGYWSGDLALVATSGWFGDALSASPVAYAKKAPVFLVGDSLTLTDEQKTALRRAAKAGNLANAVVVGGNAVVDDSVVEFLGDIAESGTAIRLGGAEQYDTSKLIAEWAVDSQGFTWNDAAFTTGGAPYDALAGSVLQGSRNAVLLLVDSQDDATVSAAMRHASSIAQVSYFGGPVAVPNELRAFINAGLSQAEGVELTGVSYTKMLDMEYEALKGIDGSLPKSSRLGYTRDDVDESLDPSGYELGDPEYYQFAVLNDGYSGAVSAEQIDTYINAYGQGGKLVGMGTAFVTAAKLYNVNEVYLLANAIMESGWGRSSLAMGTEVDGIIYHNFYGIGAYDTDPLGGGSKTAGAYGWDSPEAAILGAAKWISENYLNDEFSQNTLYKMRWNYAQVARDNACWKQYASNRSWATSIAGVMNSFYFYSGIPGTETGLRFLVPAYE